MDGFVDIISSVGFPIFCCVMLGVFIWKLSQKMMDINKEREEELYRIVGRSQEQLDKLEDTNQGFVKVLEAFKNDTDEIKSDIEDIKDILQKGE